MAEIYKPITFNKWGKGLVTTQEASDLPLNAGVLVQNLDISSGGGIGPRAGRTLFGNRTTTKGKISAIYNFKTREGNERPVRVRTSLLEYYDPVNDTWNTLKTGLNTNLITGFAPYNTSSVNQLYISNGTDNYTLWNGAVTNLNGALSGGEATITVDDASDFASTGTLIIGGHQNITYTGTTSTTFTGCSNTPAASDDVGVTQLTSEPTLTGASNPLGSILLSADARMWIGKNSTLIGSQVRDAEDFSSSSPRVPDEGVLEDFVEGGGKITALHTQDGAKVVFMEDAIILYQLIQQNVATDEYPLRTSLLLGPSEGCITQKGVVGSKYGTFYISERGLNVLRRQGNASLAALQPVFLFDDIRPTIKDYVFDSDSCIGLWDERIHVACKFNSGSSNNDRIIVYDIRTGGVVIVIGWYINQFITYNNAFYGAASSEQNCFKLYDTFTDDSAPIDAKWRTRRNDFEIPAKEKELYTIYIEGLIATGTKLDFTIRYDDDGSRKTVDKSINGATSNKYIFQTTTPNTLGVKELASEPLAGTVAGTDDLNKFRVYLELAVDTMYNFDLTIGSSSDGARWKVTQYAPHVISKDTIPEHLKV